MYKLYCDRCDKEIKEDQIDFVYYIKMIKMQDNSLESSKHLCGDCKAKLARFMKGEELQDGIQCD